MRAVILGASGGMGQALARALGGKGDLLLVGRRLEVLEPLGKELGAQTLRADLEIESEVHALADRVGPIDLLFHAVGVGGRALVRQVTQSLLEAMLVTHLHTAVWALKYISFTPGARAVFFGAYPQYVRVLGFAAYAAAKAALEAYVETARAEFRRQGVRLILVRMPAVATGIWGPVGGAPKNALAPKDVAERILRAVLVDEPADLIEV